MFCILLQKSQEKYDIFAFFLTWLLLGEYSAVFSDMGVNLERNIHWGGMLFL